MNKKLKDILNNILYLSFDKDICRVIIYSDIKSGLNKEYITRFSKDNKFNIYLKELIKSKSYYEVDSCDYYKSLDKKSYALLGKIKTRNCSNEDFYYIEIKYRSYRFGKVLGQDFTTRFEVKEKDANKVILASKLINF
tara:strand:+ start:2221 stop:2634 length:414 start_codon:yes stop_codon:yes gene_type:complete